MCAAMGSLHIVALLVPASRSFFQLSVPSAGMIATALASSASIGALALCGYSLRSGPAAGAA